MDLMNCRSLHLVFGGELASLANQQLSDVSNLDVVGIFFDYASAHAAWKGKSQLTVDNAMMRYFIVDVHPLIKDLDRIAKMPR